MKILIRVLVLIVFYCLCSTFTFANNTFEDDFLKILKKAEEELKTLTSNYEFELTQFSSKIIALNVALSEKKLTADEKVNLLLAKMNLKEEMQIAALFHLFYSP